MKNLPILRAGTVWLAAMIIFCALVLASPAPALAGPVGRVAAVEEERPSTGKSPGWAIPCI